MREIRSLHKNQRGGVEIAGILIIIGVLLLLGVGFAIGYLFGKSSQPVLIVNGTWSTVPNPDNDYIGNTGRKFDVKISGTIGGNTVNLPNVAVRFWSSKESAVQVPPGAVPTNQSGIATATATAIGDTSEKVKIKATWTINGMSDSIESRGYEVDDSNQ